MAYCGPRGIPYTQFLGADPRWDDLSREAALAWQADEDHRCNGCGQDRDDWYERDAEGEIVYGDDGYPKVAVPFRFDVTNAYCPACHALAKSTPDGQNRESWLHPRFVPRHTHTHTSIPAS